MATVNVPITKGKGTMEVDVDNIPADAWSEVILQGLKVVMNRGTSKITKSTYDDADALKAAAMAKAAEQLELLYKGEIKITGAAKKSKVSGAVMTEARRLARIYVKDQIKAAGGKVSHYKASAITAAANEYLASDEGAEMLEMAKANLEARTSVKPKIDLSKLAVDPKLVAAEEAKKAAKKTTISVKQAGMVQARKKGEARANA